MTKNPSPRHDGLSNARVISDSIAKVDGSPTVIRYALYPEVTVGEKSPYHSSSKRNNGNLYGATVEGGGTNNFGTIFKLSSSGAETVLYSFLGWPHDVQCPYVELFKDSAGNLWGGAGWVFKVSKDGQETLYDAPNGTAGPSVVPDSEGNFYGTLGSVGYYGGIFKMDPTGAFTILYSFTGGLDGTTPNGAGVIRDAKGNLYSTTYSGGVSRKYGTVFELTFPRSGFVA